MDKLRECALSYEKLFNFNYKIKAAKNGKVLDLTIFFLAEHFYHLIGLQKLADVPLLSNKKISKKSLFHDIIQGKLTYEDIKDSYYIKELDARVLYFHEMESLIFNKTNKIIVKYNKNKAFSGIEATILLFNQKENVYIHLFLRPLNYKDNQLLIPCSFFPSKDSTHLDRQEKYTILDITKEPKKY